MIDSFNIMLDPLPDNYEGYLIRTDFRIYIQITQCLADDTLSNEERVSTALWLLYGMSQPPQEIAYQGLIWYLRFGGEPFEYVEDNSNQKRKQDIQENEEEYSTMDFNADSFRIYTAFRRYYNIDLKMQYLHWAEFISMLKDLGECAYTSVIDIRSKNLAGMSGKEKATYSKLKKKYRLKPTLSKQQSEQVQRILAMRKNKGGE